jgi:hypothetical protein
MICIITWRFLPGEELFSKIFAKTLSDHSITPTGSYTEILGKHLRLFPASIHQP